MMQWCKQNKFWILLCVNACLGIFLGWISLILSYVFIWLNYKFISQMKKMLILDAVLLASTQMGAWASLFRWMNQEKIEGPWGPFILAVPYLLTLYFNVCLIFVMEAKVFMKQGKKKAACITGGLAALQILLYIFFRIRIVDEVKL